MKFRLKSPLEKPTVSAIKVLRHYSSFSMEEIKKRFANHEAIFEFDRCDEDRKTLFRVIEFLKSEGIPLEFYETDEDFEEEITEEMIQNLFDSSDEYSKRFDREAEQRQGE